MRVLQLHNHHADRGGAMEVLAHEAGLLRGAGHAVEEYTLPPVGQAELSAARAGAKAVWNFEAAREVRNRIDQFRPDVVHVHTPFPLMSPSVFRAADRAGVPAVTTLHSYRYSCVVGTCVRDGRICEDCVGSRLKLAGVRHACYHDSRAASTALTLGLVVHRTVGTFHRSVSRYLTLTDFARRLLIRDGYPASRVQVKPNSVPDPGFRERPESDERRIVFVGRLIDIKGVRTLLDAWAAQAAQAAPGARQARLVVAGDGPLRWLVEERAARDPSIDFVGWVDERRVPELMAGAEVVVVPSEWYEGAPLVISRSLGVGTPVLVSDLENLCSAVLEDGAGWSFRTGDVASLAEQLGLAVACPGRSVEMRRHARASYERRYSPEVDVARLERVYREVLLEAGARHGG